MAWGQLARVCEGEHLNLILIRLLEFFGSSNSFHHSLALYELHLAAQSHNQTPWQLFTPFWPSISVLVVKQYTNKPAIMNQITGLLDVSVEAFYSRTQYYTVPYMILSKRFDVVKRIAEAANCATKNVYINNLSVILAVILVHDQNPSFTKQLLAEADNSFKTVEFSSLIRSNRINLAYEVLKLHDPADEERSKSISKVLNLIANNGKEGLIAGDSVSVSSSNDSQVFTDFLLNYVLGIVTQFSATIRNVHGRESYTEKLRCLNGLQKMMEYGSKGFSSAVPQICAFLQSALDTTILQSSAFESWLFMLKYLTYSELNDILDLTFAVPVQKWDHLNPEARVVSTKLMQYAVDNRKQLFIERGQEFRLPSTGGIPDLEAIQKQLDAFSVDLNPAEMFRRLLDKVDSENIYIVRQGLLELQQFLVQNQDLIVTLAEPEKKSSRILETALRILLDVAQLFQNIGSDIPVLSAQCIGLIGAVQQQPGMGLRDPRDSKDSLPFSRNLILIDNFEDASESTKFVLFFIQKHLVKAFRASTDPSSQEVLAFALQECLRFCNLTSTSIKTDDSRAKIWNSLSYNTRSALLPLLSSKYIHSSVPPIKTDLDKPMFNSNISHHKWLQKFMWFLLSSPNGKNAEQLFGVFRKLINDQDLNICSFLLPYAALNVVLGGTDQDRSFIAREMFQILSAESLDRTTMQTEQLKSCYQSVFSMVDYFSSWIRRATKHGSRDGVRTVEQLMAKLSPELMAKRSYECKSFPRAIMYWEQYLRRLDSEESLKASRSHEAHPDLMAVTDANAELTFDSPTGPYTNTRSFSSIRLEIYSKFQEIYANIEDPDALEGLSTKFPSPSLEQQILQYEGTSKWNYAIESYEVLRKQSRWNFELQKQMLLCLRNSGRYEDVLAEIERGSIADTEGGPSRKSNPTERFEPGKPDFAVDSSFLMPFAVESCWLSGNMTKLSEFLQKISLTSPLSLKFEVAVGRALQAVQYWQLDSARSWINIAREDVIQTLLAMRKSSPYHVKHSLMRLHGLADLESTAVLADERYASMVNHKDISSRLDDRLSLLASDYNAKRYLLAMRRVTMTAGNLPFSFSEVCLTWVHSARNSRKHEQFDVALQASLQALEMDPKSARAIKEYSKLLWEQGEQRLATSSLERIVPRDFLQAVGLSDSSHKRDAALLYNRWLDASNNSDSTTTMKRYGILARAAPRWEKSHYFLARYCNKLYDTQLALPEAMRHSDFNSGEYIRLMIFSYSKSLNFGVKYLYQTLPKMITLWLDFSEKITELASSNASRLANTAKILAKRKEVMEDINKHLKRYVNKLPKYVFYVALPQLLSRISHKNHEVYTVLLYIVVEIAKAYPEHALWHVLTVWNSKNSERKERGSDIVSHLRAYGESAGAATSVREILPQAIKMVEELTHFCNFKLNDRLLARKGPLSLKNDFKFDPSTYPCPLVVPVQGNMTASLPNHPDKMKHHTPFPPSSSVFINSIEDQVDIMSSLQKPKRISIRGNDGVLYKLLCKPHDDVRKDARLMEFTSSIDRLLKKDDEASKRNLTILTYFVTPLNEDCGLIEWVNDSRPMRDIIAKSYNGRKIHLKWMESKEKLESNNLAVQLKEFHSLLEKFPPVLYEWFIETFPEPSIWLSSRNHYARTCAVMSIVGYILGHGENILFSEITGGVLHVDFDCLFDKGIGLDVAERVPFRLTHNMVDSLGIVGYEGTFRKTCEVTLKLLRNNEDMLMTILETFLHDPIVEWSTKKRTKPRRVINDRSVANSPEEALSAIRNKIRGIRVADGIPFSISGQVEYLIQQAISEENLAQMYIGWMAFW